MSTIVTAINEEAAYIAAVAGAVMMAIEATRKRKRKFWLNPKKCRRDNCTQASGPLDQNIFKFETDLKMSKKIFQKLMSYVEDSLTRQDTLMRKAIPALDRLAVTLKYLSFGETYTELEKQTYFSKSAICVMIHEACDLFHERLVCEYMKFPSTPEDWTAISEKFCSKWGFPFCIGALAGRTTALRTSRTDVPKKKHRGSDTLQILALVDADYKFILADIFRYNREREDDIKYSELMKIIDQSRESFPKEGISLQGRKMPYMFVADETFALDEFILTPYPEDQNLNYSQREFNHRLLQAQGVANTALAILTKRFRILYNDQCLHACTIEYVFKACIILHNFMVCHSKEYLEELLQRTDLPNPKMIAQCTSLSCDTERLEENRQKFVDLFLNESVDYSRDPLL